MGLSSFINLDHVQKAEATDIVMNLKMRNLY